MELFSLLGILAFFVVPMIIIALLFDNEYVGWGLLTIAATVITLVLVGGIQFWLAFGYYLITNPMVILQYALYYVGLGVVWAFSKWVIFGRDQVKKYRTQEAGIKDEWTQAQSRETVRGYTYAQYVKSRYGFPPLAVEHKADITEWMAFWPFSVIATFFGDFLGRFFRWVFDWIKNSFDHVMAYIWSGTDLNAKN